MTENFKVDQATYDAIAKEIQSDDSPVGIDAKKTHIIILHKLEELAKRLEKIEQQLAER